MSVDQLETGATGSVLQKGAEIRGNIRTERDICLKGVIFGDVTCGGCLTVDKDGVVEGNINCRELVLHGLIIGDVEVEGRACISESSVIKGSLTAGCVLVHPEAVVEKGLRFKDKQ